MSSPPQPHARLNASSSAPVLRGSGTSISGLHDEPSKPVAARPGRHAAPPPTTMSTPAYGLYSAPSHGSLYVDEEDLEPGPGTYELPSNLGHQWESMKESAPHISLTAKHDKSWAKVMITKDHLNILKGRDTPGPGTYQPGHLTSQVRVKFGTSSRDQLADTSFRAPGPIYEVRTNPDTVSHNQKFGKANRFAMDKLGSTMGATGPGQYELTGSFEGMKLAKSFGCSHRAYDKVRFPGSERHGLGRQSSGPGPAYPFENVGKKFKFGKAERMPADHQSKRMPGPGTYDHDRPCPDRRSQSVYSFGKPHAKGRMDMKAMRNNSQTDFAARLYAAPD